MDRQKAWRLYRRGLDVELFRIGGRTRMVAAKPGMRGPVNYGKITDDEILEGSWQGYAPTSAKGPHPSPKALSFLIDNQFKEKKPLAKPERFVANSLIDQLEKNGFIDSVYK